ncbi:MAG: hypothetical protein HW384_14 [Dehalococcoidia bacterium]|nr:hypothetical protein [Dehalococcoidia bacterium]
MRIVFFVVVNIGLSCLKGLLESGANVAGIFTANKQDMVKTSGMHPDYFSEFDDLAKAYNIPLYKVRDVSVPIDIESLKRLRPDIIFFIGWPQMVREDVLRLPPHGCVGIHPTLLPQRRGGAPLNWCLIDGLDRSGVSLIYLESGVDSGDIIAQRPFKIELEDNIKTVLDKVTAISAEMVKESYPLLEKGIAPRIPQDHRIATYTWRRRPEQGLIDWNRTSLSLYNWVRALSSPFPGAFTFCNGRKLLVWEAGLVKSYRPPLNAVPGQLVEIWENQGVIVSTTDHCILIKNLQWESAPDIQRADLFMKANNIPIGTVLGGCR